MGKHDHRCSEKSQGRQRVQFVLNVHNFYQDKKGGAYGIAMSWRFKDRRARVLIQKSPALAVAGAGRPSKWMRSSGVAAVLNSCAKRAPDVELASSPFRLGLGKDKLDELVAPP